MSKEKTIVEKAVEAAKKKRRCFGYLFYGDSQKDITCTPIPQFSGITTLLELFAVLEKCWAKETAYPSDQADWVPNDPSYGQCAITATLVHDMFGGTIHKIKVNGGGTHYFNKINGQYVDLTREQFDLYDLPVKYEPNQEIPREYCGKNKDTSERYKKLQRNIMRYLNQEDKAESKEDIVVDKKTHNIAVFADTQQFYQTNPILQAAIQFGRKETKLYAAGDYPDLPILGTIERLWLVADDPDASLSAQDAATQAIQAIENGAPFDPVIHGQEIRMYNARTLEAAMKLRKEFPDKKIAVLNFASATRPGGGVKTGSSAQEEALCRCSTLFPTLDRKFLWQQYYDVNRAAKNLLYSDACIYSPGVIICKTDDSHPQRLPQDQFVTIDVISCAAPNLRSKPSNYHNPSPGKAVKITNQQLYEIQLSRARHILHIAAYNKVDILILGAFGCGAFENDPDTVASAWRRALIDYQARFDVVEFAIPKKPGDTRNYDAFHKMFELYLHE